MSRPVPSSSNGSALKVHGLGVLLFLFIPLVLYLLLARPEPLGLSLGIAVILMVGHRFLARPYMFWVADRRCLWSGSSLGPEDGVELEIHHRGGVQPARCRERHRWHLERFFTFVRRARFALAGGIFAPLLLLLGSLAAAALGHQPPLPLDTVRGIFQLSVGLAVNLAAWGYLSVKRTDEPLRVLFPIHNFFLLGVSKLLWIFRIMGLWWIVVGTRLLFS